MRRAGQALVPRIRKLGAVRAAAEAVALIRWLEDTSQYDALCVRRRRHSGRRALLQSVLFPDPGAECPRHLHFRFGLRGLDHPVAAAEWPIAADLLHLLARGASPQDLAPFQSSPLRGLCAELAGSGFLCSAGDPVDLPGGNGRLLFVGHNSVLIASGSTRVLVDPWFRPAHDADSPQYRPLQPADLGPVDAIAITHSHGDHFHLGSLLAFGRDVPIFVPAIARESLLSTDIAARLASVGFRKVTRLRWWQSAQVGDVKIDAMPFYGEQPTDGEGVYPGLWNEGNTYRVRTPGLSAVFLADSGRDVRGDMLEVGLRAARSAPVDVVFTGIRGFRLRPIFYPFTTIDAFLANVPLDRVAEPVSLMSDASGALDIGEAMGARWVVPYADGGAPWYWREGMGPFYEGFTEVSGFKKAPPTPADDPDSDPFPERLAEERLRRGHGPEALVLRPGDAMRKKGKGLELHRYEGFAWPYD